MSSIVIELQQTALDSSVKVSDLLRKAMVVAKKLGILDFEKWTVDELDGYKDIKSIPDYRIIYGEVKVWNPYRSEWQPVLFQDNAIEQSYTRHLSHQSVSELEALFESSKTDNTKFFIMNFSAETQAIMRKNSGAPTSPVLHIPVAVIVRILDKVRTIILYWSLKLEEEGILGDRLSFSEKEKRMAAQNIWNVNNFYGAVSGSQFQQNPSNSPITVNQLTKDLIDFIEKMRSSSPQLNLEKSKESEIKDELDELEKQTKAKKPNTTKIKSSLQSIGRVLEGAVGNAIGAGLYNTLIQILNNLN